MAVADSVGPDILCAMERDRGGGGVTQRNLIVALVLLAFVASAGCSASTTVTPDVPKTATPVEPSKATTQFIVVSGPTMVDGTTQVWCIYVEGFKDNPSVWGKIRSHGVELAAQSRATNSQLAVAVYYFDDVSKVMTPEVIHGFWAIEGKMTPYCIASVETWSNGNVVAFKYHSATATFRFSNRTVLVRVLPQQLPSHC